jgi:hypothetical protein
MANTKGHTYDYICFTDLIYESGVDGKEVVEKKIKRRLKYHKLGEYNQLRVDNIRKLRDTLWAEIKSGSNSKYFHKIDSIYTEMDDFDIARMAVDYVKLFNQVSSDDMRAIISYGVYYYYSR